LTVAHSLVGYTVLPQALASTSATPGHTQHFHFFTVNEPRPASPDSDSNRLTNKLLSRFTRGPKGNTITRGSDAGTRNSNGVGRGTEDIVQPVAQRPPALRFVDVPGMGYAASPAPESGTSSPHMTKGAQHTAGGTGGIDENSDEATTTSKDRSRTWRGLLDRYLRVRDSLRVVFHLVDARHGITAVDREVGTVLQVDGVLLLGVCRFPCIPMSSQ
jgi:GTP-binding protein EngB required for normal cell division